MAAPGNLGERIEVGGEAGKVNGDDHAGAGIDCSLSGGQIDVSRFRIDIDKGGFCAGAQEAGGRGREGQSGDDPLGAGRESECVASAVKGGSTAAGYDGMACAAIGCQFLFEGLDLRTGCQPVAIEDR